MCVCNRILLEFPITSGILFSQFLLKSTVRCFLSFVWSFIFEGKIFFTELLIEIVGISVGIVGETEKNKPQKWLTVSNSFKMRKKLFFFGYVHFGFLFQQRMKIEI